MINQALLISIFAPLLPTLYFPEEIDGMTSTPHVHSGALNS